MANTLRFKRGLVAGIPTALAGEPLFTTDTFDLYIGNGTTNTRFQKYIASGATTQILRGDGSLYTFPLAISSPSNGQVLKYNGTSWVNDSDSGITGSGSAGQVAYFTGATTQAGSNNLFWDTTNNRLGIFTNAPTQRLTILDGNLGFMATAAGGGEVFRIGVGASTSQIAINVGGTTGFAYSTISDTTKGALYVRNSHTNGFPAYSFLTDTNTGISNANGTADTLSFITGGTEAARIFANGNFAIGSTTDSGEKLQVTGTMKVTGNTVFNANVGIGTSPAYRFHVLAAGTDIAAFSNSTGNSLVLMTNSQTTADLIYRFRQNNGGGNFFDLKYYGTSNYFGIDYGGTSALTIDANRNLAVDTNTLFVDATNNRVGIGTATPDATLRVAGTVNGTQAIFSNVDGRGLQISTSVISGTNEAGVVLNARSSVTSGTFIFQTDGTQRMQLDSAGLEFPNNYGLLFENTSASPVGRLKMTSTNILQLNYNDTFTFNLLASSCFTGGDANFGIGQGGSVFGSGTRTMSVLSGTAPTSSQTSSFLMYSQAVTTGNAAPHFRTENGAVIKLYQETTAVGNAIISLGGGNAVLDDTTFDGYTLRQLVRALRNQGILQ